MTVIIEEYSKEWTRNDRMNERQEPKLNEKWTTEGVQIINVIRTPLVTNVDTNEHATRKLTK